MKERKLIKVLICGDRNWKASYARIVNREVKALAEKYGIRNLLIIEGGAPGVDSLVKLSCLKHSVHCAEISALWKTRGKSAGPQRNQIMALLKPHEIIAIHDDIDSSVGTLGMIELANKMGKKPRLIEK